MSSHNLPNGITSPTETALCVLLDVFGKGENANGGSGKRSAHAILGAHLSTTPEQRWRLPLFDKHQSPDPISQ